MICGTLFATYCLLGVVPIDGDTFRAEVPYGRQSFRLWGISAPERRDPGGLESRDNLLALTAGQLLACVDAGPPSFSRLVVSCRRATDAADIGCLQVEQGHAFDWPSYSGGHYAECAP